MKFNVTRRQLQKFLIIIVILFLFSVLLNYLIMPWYVAAPEVKVPKVTGMNQMQAIQILEENDLEGLIGDTTFDSRLKTGYIVIQKPQAGDIVKEGRRVYLVVNGGSPKARVPDLKGKSVVDAKFALERVGLKLGDTIFAPSQTPKDIIISQEFVSNTELRKGQTVNVTVSSGAEKGTLTIPDLIGKSLSEAETILAALKLRVGKINYQPSFQLLPNTIIDHYPTAGMKASEGDFIDLFVTKLVEIKEESER